MRPATLTRSPVSVAGRQIGVAPVEFGGLVLARKPDRIRVDAHIAQRFELVEPHPAERVVGFGGARGGIIVGGHKT